MSKSKELAAALNAKPVKLSAGWFDRLPAEDQAALNMVRVNRKLHYAYLSDRQLLAEIHSAGVAPHLTYWGFFHWLRKSSG